MPSLCNSLHASTLEFGDSAPISAVSALPRSLLGPRMRNSEGVPKDGGKHPNFSAETENGPGPAGAPAGGGRLRGESERLLKGDG